MREQDATRTSTQNGGREAKSKKPEMLARNGRRLRPPRMEGVPELAGVDHTALIAGPGRASETEGLAATIATNDGQRADLDSRPRQIYAHGGDIARKNQSSCAQHTAASTAFAVHNGGGTGHTVAAQYQTFVPRRIRHTSGVPLRPPLIPSRPSCTFIYVSLCDSPSHIDQAEYSRDAHRPLPTRVDWQRATLLACKHARHTGAIVRISHEAR